MLSRIRIIIGAFIVTGAIIYFIHPKDYPDKTEAWMEKTVPERIDGFTLASSSNQDPGARMDEATYAQLLPFGIVTRKYTGKDNRSYDFIVIAGNNRRSFHDPVVCFSAQNWEIKERKLQHIEIPAIGGSIPATLMSIEQPGLRGTALFFYKDPLAWRHSPLYVPFDLTAARLMMRESADAQFFRLIVWPATVPDGSGPDAFKRAQDVDLHALEGFAEAMFSKFKETEDGRYFVEK